MIVNYKIQLKIVKKHSSDDECHEYYYNEFMYTIYTTRKTMAGSIQNQQRIVGRGCYFGHVGPVRLQQRVVDHFY